MFEKKRVLLAVLCGVCLGFGLRLLLRGPTKNEYTPENISKLIMHIPSDEQRLETDPLLSPDVARIQDNCYEEPPITPAPTAPAVNGADKCVWAFYSYEPSFWEKEWLEGEESGKRRDRECEVLAQKQEITRSRQLIGAVTGLVLHGEAIPKESINLFSRMIYARRCGVQLKDTGERRALLIEPLVGLLRDPLTICRQPADDEDPIDHQFSFGEDSIQSKRHLLIGPVAPWTDLPHEQNSWRVGGFEPWAIDLTNCRDPRIRQNILVDIGASLYGGWRGNSGGVGALWFVDRYGRHQVSFDRIISFEIEKHDPDEIYQSVPKDILPHYIYFNQGVEATPNGKWNPWRILQGMGITTNDYVVVKLDIDTPIIENPLIDQIINDPKIRGLIDEVYFEHHVNVKAMWNFWRTENSPLTLKDSYRIFGYLRSKGVRMHSWP